MSRVKSQGLRAKELERKISELTEALQRERADSVNLRRRVEEERLQLGTFYKSTVIRKLLPAIDNLERALMHIPKDLKNHDYVKGVRGVVKQFEQCFKQLGVERIKTISQQFDPRYHEAISVEDPSTSSGQAHNLVEVVCEELQPGYKLGDEIIRHATVKVRMEKSKEE
ncbi:MAG TPA: nucleotide exchange factor GrpE [Candidatus Saccharimonadales bacterium]|nr:nucleotide exchange factor GrpE [Candidatus Saccharimonadales bacterium]